MEFITEIDKEDQIKIILGLGSSNIENFNNDFYSYFKRMIWRIHTTSIIMHQSNTKRFC